jgi:hypothetical protein
MKEPQLPGKYHVTAVIDLNASQSKVWNVLQDFSNVYLWAPSVTESHALGNKTIGVGAGRHCKLDGFGEIDEYITTWQEGTGFVYNVTPLGPLDNAHSSWWLSANDEHNTRLKVVFSYDIRFGLFGRIMHKLIMRSKLEKSLPETLKAVKNRVENNATVRPILNQAVTN